MLSLSDYVTYPIILHKYIKIFNIQILFTHHIIIISTYFLSMLVYFSFWHSGNPLQSKLYLRLKIHTQHCYYTIHMQGIIPFFCLVFWVACLFSFSIDPSFPLITCIQANLYKCCPTFFGLMKHQPVQPVCK